MTEGRRFLLEIDLNGAPQSVADDSFIGGIPKLPPNTPAPQCTFCHNEMAFFFQAAFPPSHLWAGESLALFACVSCQVEGHFIPEMLTTQLPGADIPVGFLTEYQTNFRLLTFKTASGVPMDFYKEAVRFRRWLLVPTKDDATDEENPNLNTDDNLIEPVNKIGGVPSWILDDEAPATYGKTTEMCFLLQIEPRFEFEILDSAPRQMDVEYSTSGVQIGLVEMENDYYELFIGNASYFFGTSSDKGSMGFCVVSLHKLCFAGTDSP